MSYNASGHYPHRKGDGTMSRVSTNELSTKQKLIEAAISIIEADGEVAIRVDQVAERAGFTKPVLYHHFADREAIIAAAQAERFRRSLEVGWEELAQPLQAVSSAEQFYESLWQWISSTVSVDGEVRRRFRTDVLGSAISRPLLMQSIVEASRSHAEKVAMSIEVAQGRGWISANVTSRDLAHWWIGLISTRIFFEIDRESFNIESWDALTKHTLRSMINF